MLDTIVANTARYLRRQKQAGKIPDADGNGLPDLWELAHFGTTGQNPQAVNANGFTTMGNFIAGTDPNDATSRFQVHVEIEDGERKIWFFARAVEGSGYAAMSVLPGERAAIGSYGKNNQARRYSIRRLFEIEGLHVWMKLELATVFVRPVQRK